MHNQCAVYYKLKFPQKWCKTVTHGRLVEHPFEKKSHQSIRSQEAISIQTDIKNNNAFVLSLPYPENGTAHSSEISVTICHISQFQKTINFIATIVRMSNLAHTICSFRTLNCPILIGSSFNACFSFTSLSLLSVFQRETATVIRALHCF